MDVAGNSRDPPFLKSSLLGAERPSPWGGNRLVFCLEGKSVENTPPKGACVCGA